MSQFNRRDFLSASTAGLAGALPLLSPNELLAAQKHKPKVAVIFTEFRFRSHTYNILENFFAPYLFDGRLISPGVDVVSFYADQFPADDMARDVAKRFKIPIFKTIGDALRLGTKNLAVDAVLSIAEHGDYPYNKLGQKQYPRKRFFDESVKVMKQAGRFVPFFNDKHLNYRWDWAKEIYDTAVKHGIPLMAGSSVPLAERRPLFELPAQFEMTEAVSVHGGGIETYDFHGLEVLQSIVEARKHGETGIESVEFFSPERFKRAMKAERWSADLIDAAMEAEKQAGGVERQPRPAIHQRRQPLDPKKQAMIDQLNLNVDHAIEVNYKDGLRAVVLRMGNSSNRWNFACHLKGESKPRATSFYNGPWGNRCLFKALSHSIQHFFRSKQAPYPVERTLLTSGILDVAMHSRMQGDKKIRTPELNVRYQPKDFVKFREMGRTWKIITQDTRQPADFSPGDERWVEQSNGNN